MSDSARLTDYQAWKERTERLEAEVGELNEDYHSHKNCPFCGCSWTAYCLSDIDSGMHLVTIECDGCGCKQEGKTVAEAIANWDRRAE